MRTNKKPRNWSRALVLLLLTLVASLLLFTRKQQASAPIVTITEFSDFQCPYCKRAASVVEQIRQLYGERVKVVFKQMPLPMHKQAFKAAQASVCAGQQGKFWEYHDRLFAAGDLPVDVLSRIAEEVGLQQDKFSQCLDSPTSRAEVEKDVADAERLGVSGTPTFFINGKVGKGANTFESLKREIDQALPNPVPNMRPVSLTNQSSLSATVVAANTKCGGINCDDGNACTKDICDSKSACRHVPYEMCGSAICYNSAAIANGLANGGLAGCQSNSVCTDPSLPIGCVATDTDGDGFTDAQEDAGYIDLNCNGIKDDADFVFPHADFTRVNEGGSGPAGTGLLLTNRTNSRRSVNASSVVVTITTGGQVGSAQFTYTIDGGRTIGPTVAGAAVDIRGNIRLTFADGQVNPSFIAGNTYSFSSGDFKVADKNKPNIYLQYDYMDWSDTPSHACSQDSDCVGGGGELFGERCHRGRCNHNHDPEQAAPGAISKVADAYAAHGITLYIDPVHQALPHSKVVSWRTPELACEGADVADGLTGAYAVNFFNLKAIAFDPRRQGIFHYALFGHYSGCDFDAFGTHCNVCPSAGPPGRSGQPSPGQSGMAEVPGNDFIVSLGHYSNDQNHPANLFDVGGTFMHELGHNLGLRHAGDGDTPSYKPNYLSVMNYNFQFTGIAATDAPPADPTVGVMPSELNRAKTRLDYSEETVATLDEVFDGVTHFGLDESTGANCGGVDSLSVFGYSDDNGDFAYGSCTGPVNWDIIDGDVTGTNLQQDLNQGDHPTSVVHTQLTGHTDWGASFIAAIPSQCTEWGSADGAAPLDRQTTNELTPEMAIRAHVLYPPRPVQIDITPECPDKTLTPGRRGEFSVALLGADDLDVRQIETSSLRFHGATAIRTDLSDVNSDGKLDLLVVFDQANVRLNPQAKAARLTGWLKNSQVFIGADRINVAR